MSIVRKIRSKSHRLHRGNRELARAVASAPTRSSREELLLLSSLGR